jgi:hypothetical protein
MSEQSTNPVPASAKDAVEYITNALVNDKLSMNAACKDLGWSFPRIRSRALTIAKGMQSVLTKVERGIYILDSTTSVNTDATIGADAEPTLDPAKVEAALLGNTPPSSTK